MKQLREKLALLAAIIFGASLFCVSIPGRALTQEEDTDPANRQEVVATEEAAIGVFGDITKKPDKGVIAGFLWDENDINGIREAGEAGIADATVVLQQQLPSGWENVADTTTQIDGSYMFHVLFGTYRVVFPDRAPKVFTLPEIHHDADPKTSSDALEDGTTNPLVVDQEKIYRLDAGYAPIVLPNPTSSFSKYIVSNNLGVEQLSLHSPKEPITFVVRAAMNHMLGYHDVQIKDRLDPRLEFISGQVFANGQDITAKGAMQHNPENNTVSFTFARPLDKTLANTTVDMYLSVKIKSGIDSYADITNTATLRINDSMEIYTPKQVVLRLEYGMIAGYVFEDLNGNGLRDEHSRPVANVAVDLLEKKGFSTQVIATATTNEEGYYRFTDETGQPLFLPFGTYNLKARIDDKNYTYTRTQVTGTGFNGYGSDARQKDGMVTLVLDAGLRMPLAGIGILKNTPPPDPGDLPKYFTKQPSARQVKSGDAVSYSISGFGNVQKQPLEYCGVTDIIPEGLLFVSGQVPAFKQGKSVTYSVEYMTNQRSSARVLHSNVSAASSFSFLAPPLHSGERVTLVRIRFNTAPAGFGVDSTITFNFTVSEDNTNPVLVNSALWFQGNQTVTIKAEEVTAQDTSEQPDDQAAEDANKRVEIILDNQNPEEIPLTEKPPHWSILNLIIVFLSFLYTLLMLVFLKRNYRVHNETFLSVFLALTRKLRLLATFSVLLWIAGLLLLLVTQNWRGIMVIGPDKWTPTILGLDIIGVALSIRFWFRKKQTGGYPEGNEL